MKGDLYGEILDTYQTCYPSVFCDMKYYLQYSELCDSILNINENMYKNKLAC